MNSVRPPSDPVQVVLLQRHMRSATLIGAEPRAGQMFDASGTGPTKLSQLRRALRRTEHGLTVSIQVSRPITNCAPCPLARTRVSLANKRLVPYAHVLMRALPRRALPSPGTVASKLDYRPTCHATAVIAKPINSGSPTLDACQALQTAPNLTRLDYAKESKTLHCDGKTCNTRQRAHAQQKLITNTKGAPSSRTETHTRRWVRSVAGSASRKTSPPPQRHGSTTRIPYNSYGRIGGRQRAGMPAWSVPQCSRSKSSTPATTGPSRQSELAKSHRSVSNMGQVLSRSPRYIPPHNTEPVRSLPAQASRCPHGKRELTCNLFRERTVLMTRPLGAVPFSQCTKIISHHNHQARSEEHEQ